MKKLTIGGNDAGQRLDKLMTKAFPDLPMSLMYKAIRTKNIKVNGKRAQISQRLLPGDELALYLPDDVLAPRAAAVRYDFMVAPASLDIVYEDSQILLVNKKQGVLVHPDKDNYGDTLLFRIQRYLYEKGEYDPAAEHSFAPALANRIDRGTGGIVIACKTAEALREMNERIKARELDKRYYCLVHGAPNPPVATLEGYLFKDAVRNRVFVSREKQPGAQHIITKYTTLDTRNDVSLLDVELITGRTHQIRAHLAHIGHPLVGDGKYGRLAPDKKQGHTRQALCCYQIGFRFSSDACVLNHLNGQSFTVSDIWFKDEFLRNGLSQA